MPVKCAVNGFGRIGRLCFRYAWEDPTLEIVHVNDVCSCESAAYLLQFDSVHGTWKYSVEASDSVDEHGNSYFMIDGTRKVTFSQQKDFTQVDWKGMGVELVMECTGKFLTVKELSAYQDTCGVQQVVVSAPVKETGALNVVLGCNHQKITPDLRIVTNASCTTNCLAPVVKVIQEQFGIVHGCITTIHDVTGYVLAHLLH
jgi:glyceraldehyde 3-phosphate dehydrogenase